MPNTSGLTWAAVTAPDPYLRGRSALTLFETHIQVAGDFGCWLWTRKLSRGYGSIYAAGRRTACTASPTSSIAVRSPRD
jgi:hypothetical protein